MKTVIVNIRDELYDVIRSYCESSGCEPEDVINAYVVMALDSIESLNTPQPDDGLDSELGTMLFRGKLLSAMMVRRENQKKETADGI